MEYRSEGPFGDWVHRPPAAVSTSLATRLGIAVYVAEPGPVGEWLHVSPAIEAMLGVSPDCLLADRHLWVSMLHPDDRDALMNSEVDLSHETRATADYRVVRPDGRVVWLLDDAVVGRGPTGRPVMDGYLVDITSQRRAEQMLAAYAGVVERTTGRVPLTEVLAGLPVATLRASSGVVCVIELASGERVVAMRSDVDAVPTDGAVRAAEARTADGTVAGRVVLHYAPGVEPPVADEEVPPWAADLVGLAASRLAERQQADLMYAQLAATLESTIDGIVVIGSEGRIIGHNTRFGELWDIDHGALAAGDDSAVLDAILSRLADPAGFVDILRHLRGAPDDTTSDELRTVDGRVIERQSRPLRIAGEVVGRVWSFRDTTENRRLQTELREREASLDRLVGQVRDYVIVNLDPEGRVASWNEGAARIIRYSEDEVVGRPLSVIVPDEDREAGRADRLLAEASAVGSVRDEGWCVRHPGDRFWASTTLTALHDDGGRLRGFALVMQDIGERREAQQALERRARTLATVGTIATAANSATSVGGALDTALVAVCEHGGWQLAHVYLVDDASGTLRHGAWHVGPDVDRDAAAAFIAATTAADPADLPLPAAVLDKARTVRATDPADLLGAARADAGQRAGIVAGSGVPVLALDEPVGVLEFFSTSPHPVDAEADLVMRHLGTQLGRVVERERFEQRAADLARRLARLATGPGADEALSD